jgi:hypothetical protein
LLLLLLLLLLQSNLFLIGILIWRTTAGTPSATTALASNRKHGARIMRQVNYHDVALFVRSSIISAIATWIELQISLT